MAITAAYWALAALKPNNFETEKRPALPGKESLKLSLSASTAITDIVLLLLSIHKWNYRDLFLYYH